MTSRIQDHINSNNSGRMMKQQIFSMGIKLFLLLLFTSNALACDDKSCENNYLVSTHKTINHSIHQATVSKKERAEYSANYKRQQIALVNVRRAHALNKSRKRYAVERGYQLRNNRISVLNEHRAHALNRTRKVYALTHLKQRRQMLLNARKQKVQPLNVLAQNSLKSSYKHRKRIPHSTVMSRTIASINYLDESLTQKKVIKVNRHHKGRSKRKATSLAMLKKQRQHQKLVNLKSRRANNSIKREKKVYARNKKRRDLLKISERLKSEKKLLPNEQDS